jgi:hypothetical protein
MSSSWFLSFALLTKERFCLFDQLLRIFIRAFGGARESAIKTEMVCKLAFVILRVNSSVNLPIQSLCDHVGQRCLIYPILVLFSRVVEHVVHAFRQVLHAQYARLEELGCRSCASAIALALAHDLVFAPFFWIALLPPVNVQDAFMATHVTLVVIATGSISNPYHMLLSMALSAHASHSGIPAATTASTDPAQLLCICTLAVRHLPALVSLMDSLVIDFITWA